MQGKNGQPRYQLTTRLATGWNGSSIGSVSSGVRKDYSIGDVDNALGYRWSNSSRPSESTELPDVIHFDFTPYVQGHLPGYVGGALRGSTILGSNPDFNLILVYDSAGHEVTEGNWLLPKPPVNATIPIEDLFLNFEEVYVSGGISLIHFRDFRELDHLTYGYAIPEPSAAWVDPGNRYLAGEPPSQRP